MVKPRNAAEARDLDTLIAEARNRMYFDKSISVYRMIRGRESARLHPNNREHIGEAMKRLAVNAQKVTEALRAICPDAFVDISL